MNELNDDLAIAFDDLQRSQARIHIAAIRRMELLTPEEIQQFSEDTQWRSRPLSLDE